MSNLSAAGGHRVALDTARGAVALALVLLLLSLCACRRAEPQVDSSDPQVQAAALRQRYGDAAGSVVRGGITITTPGRDPARFTTFANIDEEGRILIEAKYAGASLFDALIEPDGRAIIRLLRGDKKIVRGDLDELAAQPGQAEGELGLFATHLRLFLDEVRHGPLPVDGVSCATTAGLDFALAQSTVSIALDSTDGLVLSKRVCDPTGTERYRLDYRKPMTYLGRVTRSRDVSFSIPDQETRIRLILSSISARVDSKPLALEQPSSWPEATLPEFIRSLRKAAEEADAAVPGSDAPAAPSVVP